MSLHKICIGFALLLMALPQKALAKSTEIGVLEEQCEPRGLYSVYNARVRLAFTSTGQSWKAPEPFVQDIDTLKSAPVKFAGKKEWFILSHNKTIAKVNSKGVDEYDWYRDIGTHQLLTALPAEAKGPRTGTYAGWLGCPVRKPMVLSTTVPAKDTENWRKEQPAYLPTQEIIVQIRRSIEDFYQDREEKPREIALSKKDLIVKHQFGSESNKKLVAIQLRSNVHVRDAAGAPDRSLYWFYVDGGTRVKFIGRGLVLVDWADYNSDGYTDFLFWIDDNNVSGYLLTWNKFADRVSVMWNNY